MTDPSTPGTDGGLSFPRLSARTQRFRLGAPRNLTVSPDGSRVVFVRSSGAYDRVGRLVVLDVGPGTERVVVDPAALLAAGEEDLPPEERARRERLREGAGGVTAYAVDRDCRTAALALGGRVVVADLIAGTARLLDTATPAIDPRPSPDGRHVAYVAGGALRVVSLETGDDRALVEPDAPDVTWGLADFIAAEEMHRYRGYWWAPTGDRLLAARVDESPVQRWHIPDPAHPAKPAVEIAYPSAGTANAEVRVACLGLDGSRSDIAWDDQRFPYLASVWWASHGDPLLHVQSRDQKSAQVLAADVVAGTTRVVREDADEQWLELVPGVPAWLPDGRLLGTVDHGDTRRLAVDGAAVTPPGLQVEAVTAVDDDGVVFSGTQDAFAAGPWLWRYDGTLERLSPADGVFSAQRGGGTVVLTGSTLTARTATRVCRPDRPEQLLRSDAAAYPFPAAPDSVFPAGPRQVRTAVVLPREGAPGPLPVLLDPYGGPGHREVVAAQGAWVEPQWLADQGFAVVVADGRGTPGRGPRWERAISEGRWAEAVLEDQVDALHAAAERYPGQLDLSRVAIRGWSFGGYLAALAVLRRPDVFHAAVAGAPVTDFALYDTHYTERYLGLPQEHPERYAANSLLDDAPRLRRPLLLIHGLADDNVVSAHTLRLSTALLAAGRPHTVLPLSGVSHMTPQEAVAENLLLLQVEFLRESLRRPPATG
ncbi:S9 family peptidase [Motilibacter deserti]|uniref:S9 family peptidase n=1 Tax=Motilibacter deserti TaxID=2714956 RepID=A0ABX0GQN7_9ACTN|nr:S9 family peptidase [Motilibacter deserti]